MSLRSRHALQFTWNTAAAGYAFFGQEITSHKERLAEGVSSLASRYSGWSLVARLKLVPVQAQRSSKTAFCCFQSM
jgi:hypothetical protein